MITFRGTALSYWFRYVVDTWVKIRTREVEAVTEHITAVDSNIKLIQEDVRGDGLPFMDSAVHTEDHWTHWSTSWVSSES